MFSAFVLGFAVSEVSGRFGEGNLGTKERRDRLGPGELPVHHCLGEVLDLPVDWDAEFEEGSAGLVAMVEEEAAAAKAEWRADRPPAWKDRCKAPGHRALLTRFSSVRLGGIDMWTRRREPAVRHRVRP